MRYSFPICGHPNILATHRTTLEFSRDPKLTLQGDCIVSVRSGFSPQMLQKFLDADRVRIKIAAGSFSDSLTASPNRHFSSGSEMVIRLGTYLSERTFATGADKAARHLDRRLVHALRSGSSGTVTIEKV